MSNYEYELSSKRIYTPNTKLAVSQFGIPQHPTHSSWSHHILESVSNLSSVNKSY